MDLQTQSDEVGDLKAQIELLTEQLAELKLRSQTASVLSSRTMLEPKLVNKKNRGVDADYGFDEEWER